LLDWVELLAAETGLPVGIKSAVGDMRFWEELTSLMAGTGRGVDFITIDGGEGGTGAAPLIFTDSVSLPFQLGFSRVYTKFAERNLQEQVVFIGGGKLGLPDNAIVAFALGCDMVNVAREAMLSIGCIQAQKWHTDTCPTGVATQNASCPMASTPAEVGPSREFTSRRFDATWSRWPRPAVWSTQV
jgi:glutamate synthase domain-containing protein 2